MAIASIRPFSNGDEFSRWEQTNCFRCRKGAQHQPEGSWPACEIEAALTAAYVGDGTVEPAIAIRMGHFDARGQCREFQPTGSVTWKNA